MSKVEYKPIVIQTDETIEDTDVLFILLFGMTRQEIADQCIMEMANLKEAN